MREYVEINYTEFLNGPLGTFLLKLKQQKDNYYLNFLNPYGDLTYQEFTIANPTVLPKKGIFACSTDDDFDLKYIGRGRDDLKKRINQCGKIRATDCYKDGQSTHYKINHFISESDNGTFWFYEMNDDTEIKKTKDSLIEKYSPVWNG